MQKTEIWEHTAEREATLRVITKNRVLMETQLLKKRMTLRANCWQKNMKL